MKFYYNGNIYNISFGNRKLVSNSETLFFIWNLPSVKTCPYRTPLCEKLCYAKKAERVYKAVLPSREENLEASKSDTFIADMIIIIERKLSTMKQKKLVVRIHESGDFYNKQYTQKWLAIAFHFAMTDSRVTFICYTKSFPYFDGMLLPENFSLRASIWSDTEKKQVEIILRNSWNIYTAVESFTENDSFEQCRCADCATCGKCWNNTIPDIRCEIH